MASSSWVDSGSPQQSAPAAPSGVGGASSWTDQQASSGAPKMKWGWNPLTDFTQGVSWAGQQIDAHTKIGSFNPGIGSLLSSAANMLPGLANMGFQVAKDAATGKGAEGWDTIKAAGQGMFHGLVDTATDVVTAGGLAPWTKTIEDREASAYGYGGNSLKQYSTMPGEGFGGAVFNDAANVMMAADGVGALAKMGEVGKIAEGARAAEVADSVAKAGEAGASVEDIRQAGSDARTQAIQDAVDRVNDAGGDGEVMRQRIQNRLNLLDKVDTVKSGAQAILQPWTALRPLERYAGSLYDRTPEGEPPTSPETPSEAPGSPSEPSPVSGASQAPAQAQAATGGLFQQAFGTSALPPVKEGFTRVFRGEGGTGNAGEGADAGRWSSPSESHIREMYSQDGNVRYQDVPNSVIEAAKAEGPEASGNLIDAQGKIAKQYRLPEEYAHTWQEVPKPLTQGESVKGQVATMERPVAAPPPMASNHASGEGRASAIATQLADVPRAYSSYLEAARGVSGNARIARWAKAIVDHLPTPAVRMLQWADAHHQKLDYQAMTRQQQRALAAEARRIENLPEVTALKQQAQDIISQRIPGITPTVANNIVGQLVRAYVTHGRDLVEQLEGSRAEMEATLPGQGSLLVDSQLGYSFHIPDQLNTPEFRDQLYQLSQPIVQLRKDASDRMRNSMRLANKGIPPEDQDLPLLTKSERRLQNQAQHKLNQALKLEQTQVPKQLGQKARAKAEAEDAVAKAVSTSQAALETMVQQRTDFDRSRYVPDAINTPEKLAAATDEIAARTVRNNGATYNPTTGNFINVADGHTMGYLVGALPDSVAVMPLSDFLAQDPTTGRLHGAMVLDNMIHGYQEAFQFPNITVGTWVDGEGNVHIDPSQFLEGQAARDHALTLGAARTQQAILEVHTGDEIPVINDPNASAYFVKDHAARDARAAEYRSISDKQIEAGGTGLSDDDIDRTMAFNDRMAVTMHLLHPDQYKTADAYYRTFRVEFADRASTSGLALNEVRVMVRNEKQIHDIVRPLMQTANAESRWYFNNHDYIEKIGNQLPDVQLGLGTPFGNARTVSGKDLLYSLVAIHSINASPSENMASALAAFRNMNKTDISKLASAVKEWVKLPADERITRSGKWEALPEPVRSLMKDANQVARRQTMAVLDGHTIDTWDDNFVRDIFPEYGNKEAARLPLKSVTEEEKANTVDLQHAIMEHFGSAAQAKLRSFYENLRDPENSMSVTLDSHMARAFGEQDTFWNGPNWFKHAQMVRNVADDLTGELGRKVMPHEVQAALWYWVKTQYATVQVAGQRANILDNLKAIANGTWSRATDAQAQFLEQVRQEAYEQRPEGQLTEKRQMKFVDQPLEEGSKAVKRTVDWRRTAAKANGQLSQDGQKVVRAADDYQAVMDKVEAHVNEGRPTLAQGVLLDYMNKIERTLARKTQGENFWDMEKKDIVPGIADELGVSLPGALNEFRDELLGQFVPQNRIAGGTIRLFRNADLGTLTHEQGHLLRALTTGDDLRALEQAYGVTGGRWTPDAEEAFVHDFLATASTDEVGPMSRLKDTLAQAYGEFGGNLHPEIDGFWQKVLEPNIARVEAPGFELSTGEKLIGIEGKSELGKTMPQRLNQNLNMPTTPRQAYQRGSAGQESLDQWRLAAKQKRIADAAAARAQSHVDKLAQEIADRNVKAQATVDLLRRQADKKLAKLQARLDDPARSRIPPKWQPLMTTADKIAADVAKYPELEPILESFPKTFAEMHDYAEAHGFDPTYMPDLRPEQVRRLVAGTAQLGNQGTDRMGLEFTSGARRARRGTLQQLGAFDNSIDALVAGLNQSIQEERTNMVVDWIDRVAAKDLPVDAAGRRLGAPPGWVEWDPIRRSMLAVETPQGRVAVGGTKMIPRVVANAIREYSGPAPTNPFYRAMKAMTDPWRSLMMTANPSFYLKHFQGHLFLAALAGGLDLKAWHQAYMSARNGFTDVPELTGLNITRAEGGEPGLVGYSPIRQGGIQEAWTAGGPGEVMSYLGQKMHGVVAASDTFARAVAYFSKLPANASEVERMAALQYAYDAVVDYGNLSNTERYFVRSIIPFYSFEKGIAKIFWRMPLDHPVAAAMLMSIGKWQGEQATDDQGNPLPDRYQGVVDVPLLGKVDMQKFSPFKDLSALATPDGLVGSLQYAIQDVVRAGLGVPAVGTKAGVKVDQYGHLVPDVTPQSQLAASFLNSPQGELLQGNTNLEKFFGVPVVSQDTLNKSAQSNAISQAELANTTTAQQQKAAQNPVDTLSMQMALQQQLANGAPLSPPTLPGQAPVDMNQVQQLVQQKVAAQEAKAQATRAANPTKRKSSSGGGSSSRRSKGVKVSHGTRRAHSSGIHSSRVRYKLRQGFGKISSGGATVGKEKAIHYGGRGVVGHLKLGRKTVRR